MKCGECEYYRVENPKECRAYCALTLRSVYAPTKCDIEPFMKGYSIGYREGVAITQIKLKEQIKTARWKGAGMGDYMCSICGEIVSGNQWNYCPNCGAKMERNDE